MNFDYLVYRDQEEFDEWRVAALGGKKLVADCANSTNRASKSLRKFFHTYCVLKQEQAKIFHVNASDPYGCMVGLAARFAGVRTVILHSHNSRLKKSGMAYRMFQRLCQMCIPLFGDWYFACSDLAGEFMYGKRFQREVTWVKNGIDIQRFRFNEAVRQEMRVQYQMQDALVVGNIGRLCPQKNQVFLLQIFAELLKIRPDAHLVLIGSGELEERLMSQAGRLGILGSLLHIPATSQVERFYCMMDIFLLPSIHEGLPVTGIEAQNSGLPCVFSDCITKNTSITDRAHYLSLEQTSAEWAELIDTLSRETPVDRSVYADRVQEAGFDIKDTAAWLQEFYLGL